MVKANQVITDIESGAEIDAIIIPMRNVLIIERYRPFKGVVDVNVMIVKHIIMQN